MLGTLWCCAELGGDHDELEDMKNKFGPPRYASLIHKQIMGVVRLSLVHCTAYSTLLGPTLGLDATAISGVCAKIAFPVTATSA
jgi:hypothetical protein